MNQSSFRAVHGRNKRSDCWYKWDIASSCKHGCGDHCWRDSYRDSFSARCGVDPILHCCVIKDQSDYNISSICPVNRTYLNLKCSRTGAVCFDTQVPYRCTCSEGYLVNSHTKTECDTSCMVAIGVIFPLILICFVVTVSMIQYMRVKHRKKAAELERKIQTGIIPIKCNVMIFVDDLDEFKDYTTRLKVALQDRFPKIVCERLSTYNVINDKYEIKCDKLLVFRTMNNVGLTRKRDPLTDIMKKIRFRKGRKVSDIVLCEENYVDNKRNVNKRCLVSSMKNIGGWLPDVIQMLFDIKERNGHIYNSTNKPFFTKTEWCSSNSRYCAELRCSIEKILIICGATKAQSENTAKCKLVFIDSTDDIQYMAMNEIDLKGFFIFVSSGTNVDCFKNNNGVYVYRSKDVILGVIRLLSKLKLISNKGMKSVHRMRYNPISQKFI